MISPGETPPKSVSFPGNQPAGRSSVSEPQTAHFQKEEEQTFTNYIYANGQIFAMEEGTLNETETTRSYLRTDHLGSVIAATNIDGDIVWFNDYTPSGETTGASGFNDEFAKFTSKEMDPDTGLYYFNARWYDPTLGRFITEDPIKDGLNWYGYCANNPLRYTDPTGLRLDDDLETDLKRKDREEIELEPEKPKEPDVNSDPWGVKKAFNLDFGLDHMNDAAWFYSQGKIVRGLLSNTAGAAEAAYDLAAAYVAVQVLGVVTATASTKTEGLLQRAISGIKRGFQSVFGRTTGDAARFANQQKLSQHFIKHGNEFGNITEAQYLQRAQQLVNSQSGGNILTKLRANGDMLFFDKATGDFAVKSSEGIIRTLFKPTNGLEYFLKQ